MKTFLTLIFMVLTCALFAQVDTAALNTLNTGDGINWAQYQQLILGALALLYWFLVRLIPTRKNWDIFQMIFRVVAFIINGIVPNKNKEGSTH